MSRKHWVVRVDTVRLVNNGSSGRTGDTRPGQTTNKPKEMSVCDREEYGRGEGGIVYDVYIR
jgi:hypothetical protein